MARYSNNELENNKVVDANFTPANEVWLASNVFWIFTLCHTRQAKCCLLEFAAKFKRTLYNYHSYVLTIAHFNLVRLK